ncbi:carboxy methyl transferase for protein phosphatase 2A [Sporothrix stenoceras]
MGPPSSGPSGFQPPSQHGGGMSRRMDHTGIIQSTDTDAALSRMSAVDIGLLEDPFAQYFAGDGGGPAPRRLPIINRGTYTRTQGLDKIIRAFLSGASDREATPEASQPTSPSPTPQVQQVVSLGAGTDTRSLRLLAQKQEDGRPAFQNVIYHEIDFPTVCARKRNIVQSVPAIQSFLAGPVTEHTPLAGAVGIHRSWKAELGHGNELWAHGLDLRELAGGAGSSTSIDGSDKEVALAGLRTDVPTLLVSECCLCYLQPPEAAAVLRWFADRIKPAPTLTSGLGVVIYEPIRPFDAFGRTMVANLASRGIEMPTLAVYSDGAAQEARLHTEAGLARAKHRTIDDIWSAWVPADEQERVNRLEGLDEVEEWGLLASHYVVVWGSQGAYFDTAWAELYG